MDGRYPRAAPERFLAATCFLTLSGLAAAPCAASVVISNVDYKGVGGTGYYGSVQPPDYSVEIPARFNGEALTSVQIDVNVVASAILTMPSSPETEFGNRLNTSLAISLGGQQISTTSPGYTAWSPVPAATSLVQYTLTQSFSASALSGPINDDNLILDVFNGVNNGCCVNWTAQFTNQLTGTVVATYGEGQTARQFAEQVLAQARSEKPGANDIDIARAAYRDAIDLREQPGMSTNENLKEVEYFFRGYAGGLIAGSPSSFGSDGDYVNDAANTLMLISAPLYNGLKSLGLMTRTGSGEISSPSGTDYSQQGWFFGSAGYSPENALDTYFSPNPAPPAPLPTPTGSPASPNNFQGGYEMPGAPGSVASFLALNVTADTLYYLDPDPGDAYVLGVYDTQFAGFEVPDLYNDPDYVLSFENGSLLLLVGRFYDFGDLGMGPQSWLGITGLDTEGKAFVFGTTFSVSSKYAGIGLVTATPASAPEPGTWLMMLLGFGAIGVAFRRGKKKDRNLLRDDWRGFPAGSSRAHF